MGHQGFVAGRRFRSRPLRFQYHMYRKCKQLEMTTPLRALAVVPRYFPVSTISL
jgi:hypothetical protein